MRKLLLRYRTCWHGRFVRVVSDVDAIDEAGEFGAHRCWGFGEVLGAIVWVVGGQEVVGRKFIWRMGGGSGV